MKNKSFQAQSMTEYVVLLGLIVTVFMGLQIFVQRTLQGNVKRSADVLGLQEDWQQTDWRKGGSSQMSLATTTPLAPERAIKTVSLGGALHVEKSQSNITTGETTAEAVSEGF